MNPLEELQKHGQSIWLDYIRRSLITSGELQSIVEKDGLRGVTSNPTIFEKTIAGSSDYDGALRTLLTNNAQTDVGMPYVTFADENLQVTADVLRSIEDE